MKIITYFQNQGRPFIVACGFGLIPCLCLLDYLTGYEISFSLFYLAPIILVTWFGGRELGLAASIASSMAWLIADMAAGHPYSHLAIHYWNTTIRLGFFLIVTLLLSALKKTLEREKVSARTDYLTGGLNVRYFHDRLREEIDRCHRYNHPFTIAYVDLDNFKTVNDRFGHETGDHVLRVVANSMRGHLRKTDMVGRLGGDEFALLLPETGQEAARAAVSKLRLVLLDEMQKNGWPVTVSIGVLTCLEASLSLHELITMADNLMYAVKKDSKDGILYTVHDKTETPP